MTCSWARHAAQIVTMLATKLHGSLLSMAARQRRHEWTRHTLDGRDGSTVRRTGRALAAAVWRAEAMVGILGLGGGRVARF